jgi:hypothetical protein
MKRVDVAVKKQTHIQMIDFSMRTCCLGASHPRYTAPTSEEVKVVLRFRGWSHADAAKLVGVAYNSKGGSTTVQKWCANENSSDYRRISYAAWRLLLAYAGIKRITSKEGVEILSKEL